MFNKKNRIKTVLVMMLSLALISSSIYASGDDKGTTSTQKDIVTTAVDAGSFKTLAAALQAANLVETLKGEGPYTVFAPTDEAFAKLPEGTVEALLKDKEALTEILLYHVVSGKVTSGEVVKLTSAKTVEGKEVMIKVSEGSVYINESKVTSADVMASNGVIHVIDAVLIPEKK